MRFVNSAALALLLIIPVALVFLLWRLRVQHSTRQRIGDPQLIDSLFPPVSDMRQRTKAALWLMTVTALIIALARPIWGVRADVVTTQGVSIMMVLDVSKSMDAEDLLPSRLERAKLNLLDLLQGLEGNEVGLVLFAGEAFVQFPLTTDVRSATIFIIGASTSSITHQGTAIEDALRLAITALEPRESANRFIILLSDGENFEGEPMLAAQTAAEDNIVIHALGFGEPLGAPIPIFDENGNIIERKLDETGELVLSRLDEDTLEGVALETGGIYQHATNGSIAVRNIIDSINESEAATLGNRVETRGIERFGIFIALALMTLLFEMLLPEVNRTAS